MRTIHVYNITAAAARVITYEIVTTDIPATTRVRKIEQNHVSVLTLKYSSRSSMSTEYHLAPTSGGCMGQRTMELRVR